MTRWSAMTESGGPSAIDLALGHDHDPVGDVADHVHVVLDEEHGHALLAQRLHVAEQRLLQGRVDPGHRLVEHHQLGVDHQRARHLEQLALPAGERPGEVLALRVELEASAAGRRRASVLASSCVAPQEREAAPAQNFSPRWPVAPSRMFSITVSLESTLVSWKVRTMPSRATL